MSHTATGFLGAALRGFAVFALVAAGFLGTAADFLLTAAFDLGAALVAEVFCDPVSPNSSIQRAAQVLPLL